ncbi:MAG: flavin reductase family protein [Bacteroidales bacterium OttesenSCG-928-I14]|jgi:flavin reductase (DIM6/NTAB) family NADH-FMN oxidoreductase RutF|nr:flavin reductase family protein [Bacteroidales bacterium OttesenSCG-928-I14]
MKRVCNIGTWVYPLPAVMVSIGNSVNEYNILTIAWTGTICSEPAMCYISVRPERYSYAIIKKNREFVINLSTENLSYAIDWCGTNSGRDYNKFKEMKLTPVKSHIIMAPYIKESPLSIECKVDRIINLGTHDMFIAKVVNILTDDKYTNQKTGDFDIKKTNIVTYLNREYYRLGNFIGEYGWSKKSND